MRMRWSSRSAATGTSMIRTPPLKLLREMCAYRQR
jgi:hypothetical protein